MPEAHLWLLPSVESQVDNFECMLVSPRCRAQLQVGSGQIAVEPAVFLEKVPQSALSS